MVVGSGSGRDLRVHLRVFECCGGGLWWGEGKEACCLPGARVTCERMGHATTLSVVLECVPGPSFYLSL